VTKLAQKIDVLLAEVESMALSRESTRQREAAREARWQKVADRWISLAAKASDLMSPEEDQRVSEAILRSDDGPYRGWISDLASGRCRLPQLSAETMKQLMLAWLSPLVDAYMNAAICASCGLEYPKCKLPPVSDWKLLPGKQPGVGEPPWYDLPEFFTSCPHCGSILQGQGMDWPHLIDMKSYPWMQLDGYVGKQTEENNRNG